MIAFAAETVPLTTDPDGVARVAGTRVTLDSVVAAFREGATAEEIVQQYPSLTLADAYQVIGYVLRHPVGVESYLRGRRNQAEQVRRENEARFAPQGVRDRLSAREALAARLAQKPLGTSTKPLRGRGQLDLASKSRYA